MGVNVQYKGTDICVDFRCPADGCEGDGHYDGYFGQVLMCPSCGRLWQLPNDVPLTEVTADTAIMRPVPVESADDLPGRHDFGDVIEYAQLMAGGGYQIRNSHPDVEVVFPLRDWIRAGQAHGGRVFRRTIVVIEDWTEVER